MSIKICPECGSGVNSIANVCPKCKYIFSTIPEEDGDSEIKFTKTTIEETLDNSNATNDNMAENNNISEADKINPRRSNSRRSTRISNNKKYSNNKKKIVIIAIISLAIIIAILSIFLFYRHYNNKSYIKDISSLSRSMLLDASNAEDMGNLIHDVWYNTIYEEDDIATNKYTRKKKYSWQDDNKGEFYSDFNTSLANLFSDEEFSKKVDNLKKSQDNIKDRMRELNNPPKKYENAYEDCKNLYESYINLTDLAINPSGNLNSYSSNLNDAISKFKTMYKKMELYIE